MLELKPLTLGGFKECHILLRGYPFKPYAHYHGKVENNSLQRLFLARVETSIRDSDGSAYYILSQGRPQGLVTWTRLDWDSQQLGVETGRLDHLISLGDYQSQYSVKEVLLMAVLDDCAARGIQHLTARLHASDLSGIHVLEMHGFVIVDGILTFSFDLRDAHLPPLPGNIEIRASCPQDVEQIKDIARSSFVFDRFHSDPYIPKAVADELCAVWLENSCLGRAADVVVVASKGGRVLGFATCKVDRQSAQHLGLTIGTIVMVATAIDARGCGVAKAATYGALHWFRQQGVDMVEVGTQLRNIPASRLYESCGFRLVSSSLSLRRWIEYA